MKTELSVGDVVYTWTTKGDDTSIVGFKVTQPIEFLIRQEYNTRYFKSYTDARSQAIALLQKDRKRISDTCKRLMDTPKSAVLVLND